MNQAEELAHARQKWQEYERDYILPCFKIAEEIGFDLRAAVAEGKGNCVMRLIQELRERAADGELFRRLAANHWTDRHTIVGILGRDVTLGVQTYVGDHLREALRHQIEKSKRNPPIGD